MGRQGRLRLQGHRREPRRPFRRLHPGRRRALPRNRARPLAGPRDDRRRQPGRRDHRRLPPSSVWATSGRRPRYRSWRASACSSAASPASTRFPIALSVREVDDICDAIEAIAPSLGGINLEDISAPRCFEIEQRLHDSLDIPVMHDDQHGTAVVALAGVINALRLTNRDFKDIRTVILGAGASGIACGAILREMGCEDISLIDSKGPAHRRPRGPEPLEARRRPVVRAPQQLRWQHSPDLPGHARHRPLPRPRRTGPGHRRRCRLDERQLDGLRDG